MINLKNLILFAFLFLSSLLHAQTGPYWLLSGGGTSYDESLDISIDASGNTYSTGYFSGLAHFGALSVTSSGATDIFIAKVSPQGDYLWIVKAGGLGPDKGNSIVADAQGNSYITGFYQGQASFGSVTINSVGTSQDVFLAKYNSSGVLQWVKTGGGSMGDVGNSVGLDNKGNVIITGQFSGLASFGTQSISSMMDPSTGQPSSDVFTAKYKTSDGTMLWAKKGSASHTDRGLDIACDTAGNVFVIGQFSDTITFDVTHNNTMHNCIFLIKYNPSGSEQWFRRIGGSSQSIGYGITVNPYSEVLLTGDYINQLTFFGTPSYTLPNSFTNSIFVAKYNNSGGLLWAKSEGSNSEVTSRSIALDNNSNIYITGSFKCRMNSFSDTYGQGTFNSVGFWDVFAAKFDADGNRLWARQSGGKNDDKGYGITVNTDKDIIVCGSFYNKIFFPASAQFITNSCTTPYYNYFLNYPYCNDVNYELYYALTSTGAGEAFICKGFDPLKNPYDYYFRENVTSCVRPYVGVELTDTITGCGNAILYATPNTGNTGPDYTYLWSNGTTNTSMITNTGGFFSVTQTSSDGCFVSKDTAFVIIYPQPQQPTISDSKGINSNAVNTNPIYLCLPDSVILTGGNVCSSCVGNWMGNGIATGLNSFRPLQTGLFIFQVTDTINNCTKSNAVHVFIDTILTMPLTTIDLVGLDSITICQGESVTLYISEIMENNNYPPIYFQHNTDAIVTPSTTITTGSHSVSIFPTQNGLYHIIATHTIILHNFCSNDTLVLTDSASVYVSINPVPQVNLSITGNSMLCPGDSILYSATTNSSQISWIGPGILGTPTQTTALINAPGIYHCIAIIIDSNGCADQKDIQFVVTSIPNPIVTMNPSNGLICFNDSVVLLCSGIGDFAWYGPSGHFAGNQPTVVVNIPGFYYCIWTDTSGCVLVSNTVEVTQYTSPYLTGQPGTVICPGGTVTIEVITNPGSLVQWLPPLSGNSLSKTISSPGTYSCNVTSCNITTTLSINITLSNVTATITSNGPNVICAGDSLTLTANSGSFSYHWSTGSNSPYIVVYQPGSYTVTVTDVNGCSSTSPPFVIGGSLLAPPVFSDITLCYGTSENISASANGPIQWFMGPSGGTPFFTGNSYHSPPVFANTTYYLQTYDPICPSIRIPLHILLFPGSSVPPIHTNSPLCVGDTLHIYFTPDTAAQYSWTGPDGFSSNDSEIIIPDANINHSGTYTLTISSDSCPNLTVPVNIEVYNYPEASFTYSLEPTCEGVKAELITTSPIYTGVEWYFSDGFSSNSPSLSHVFNFNDTAIINLVVSTNNCRDTVKLSVPMVYPDLISLPPPNVFTPNGDGQNDCFRLKTAPGYSECYEMEIYNRWGRRVFKSEAGSTCWNGKDQQDQKDCAPGVYYFVMTVGTQSYHGSVTLMR